MISIAHILPSFGFGGVEIAVSKSYMEIGKNINYSLFYTKNRGALSLSQRSVWLLLYNLVTRKSNVDYLITSLWRAHFYGFLLKGIKIKWIAFFHSSSSSHFVERIFFYIAWKCADTCFVDSSESGIKMSRKYGIRDYLVINHFFPSFDHGLDWDARPIDIIFVGRLAKVKRLDLIVRLTNFYLSKNATSRIVYILAGKKTSVYDSILSELKGPVEIYRNLNPGHVYELLKESKFYVLLSDFEGFSISTTEAIMAGAIPVCRPVGEIKNYVSDDSAVLVSEDGDEALKSAVARMGVINSSADLAKNIQKICRANLHNKYKPYTTSFLNAIKKITE